MNEQKLIDALVARAAADANAFRRQYPNEAPTERWIENSYTAALPLAKDAAELNLGPGPHPNLFAAYRAEVDRIVGERIARREGELEQMPTPGEHA